MKRIKNSFQFTTMLEQALGIFYYSNHIGLANTHKRLKVTYGEQYGLVIRSNGVQ